MNNLTYEQRMLLAVVQEIFKCQIMAKVFKECFEQGIDFVNEDNAVNCIASIVAKLSPQDLNEFILEMASLPKSKFEFYAIVNNYKESAAKYVNNLLNTKPLNDFDVDSKIIN